MLHLMRCRFYWVDGRISEDPVVDDRVKRTPMLDGDKWRWFIRTDEVDPDGYRVFREVASSEPRK